MRGWQPGPLCRGPCTGASLGMYRSMGAGSYALNVIRRRKNIVRLTHPALQAGALNGRNATQEEGMTIGHL